MNSAHIKLLACRVAVVREFYVENGRLACGKVGSSFSDEMKTGTGQLGRKKKS
jgi:hypothetical protein